MSDAMQMVRTWMMAVLLCLAGIVAMLNLPGTDVAEPRSEQFAYTVHRLDPAPDILVLGSSLSLLGFAPNFRISDLKDGGKPDLTGVRIGFPCSRPDELARVMEEATARGVRLIVLEINHFLYELKLCEIEEGLLATLGDFAKALRQRLKWALLGSKGALGEGANERVILQRDYDGDTSRLESLYPLKLREPEAFDVLKPLIADARRLGSEVVFMVMPRSETGARHLGSAFDAAFAARLADLRIRFTNPILQPDWFWPDRYFADWAHMNRHGRARMLDELRQTVGALR